jgi:methionine synthase I (cobalamin-dependent)
MPGNIRQGLAMTLPEFLLHSGRTILLDGATGTQLADAGLEMGGRTNLTHPDAVRAIHEQYSACGVDLITTNTLTMNRINIESHELGVDLREVNLAGTALARAAARGGQYVLGDIGPTGKMLKPHGLLSGEEAYEAFREHAAILAEGGVDGFIIETMIALPEAVLAVRACLDAANLPVIASMTFATLKRGGRTVMGDAAADCARALTEAGASAVGANCGTIDPGEMAQIVSHMRAATDRPILAEPNAGRPAFVEGRTVFTMSPSDFAHGVRLCIEAGARMVGGCCGTTPAHIRAIGLDTGRPGGEEQ